MMEETGAVEREWDWLEAEERAGGLTWGSDCGRKHPGTHGW